MTTQRVVCNVGFTMALTTDDLKKIEGAMHKVATDVTKTQVEQLAVAVAKGFDESREYVEKGFTNLVETLKRHEGMLEEHTKILYEHSNAHRKTKEILTDHTERLERIEINQDAAATTLRDHGRRITELEQTH